MEPIYKKNYMKQIKYLLIFINIFIFFIFSPISGKNRRLNQILENAENGSPKEKKTALMMCGGNRILRCYRPMINALKNPSIEVPDDAIEIRNIVAVGLAKLRLSTSITPLKEAIQSISLDIKEQEKLIQEFEKIPSKIQKVILSKKTLVKMISAKSDMLLALGSIRDKRTVDYFIPFLEDKNTLIRMTASLCLSYLPDIKNRKVLEKYLSSEKEEIVQLELIRALFAIDHFHHEYIKLFLKKLFSDDRRIRKEAAKIGAQFKIREGRSKVETAISLEKEADVGKELRKYRRIISYY